jgi:hypothetical protein
MGDVDADAGVNMITDGGEGEIAGRFGACMLGLLRWSGGALG